MGRRARLFALVGLLMARTHRCRRSCPTQVEAGLSFCGDCWHRVPRAAKSLSFKLRVRIKEGVDGAAAQFDAWEDVAA